MEWQWGGVGVERELKRRRGDSNQFRQAIRYLFMAGFIVVIVSSFQLNLWLFIRTSLPILRHISHLCVQSDKTEIFM